MNFSENDSEEDDETKRMKMEKKERILAISSVVQCVGKIKRSDNLKTLEINSLVHKKMIGKVC